METSVHEKPRLHDLLVCVLEIGIIYDLYRGLDIFSSEQIGDGADKKVIFCLV